MTIRTYLLNLLHNEGKTETHNSPAKKSRHFACQSLSSSTIRHCYYQNKDGSIDSQTIPETFIQRPEMSHLYQHVFDNNAHMGQFSDHQLVVFDQERTPLGLISRNYTVLWQILI